jgi:ribosomal protein S18 acetylase RimI-like enzyme
MKLSFVRDGKTFIIRPGSFGDAIQVTELINLCSQALLGKDEISPGELENDWKLEGFDPQKDTLLVLQDAQLVGYADIWGVIPPFIHYDALVRVHTNFRVMGLGWLLNVWAETRAREFMGEASEGLRVFLSSYVNAKDLAAVQLLNEFGSTIERYSQVMERDLMGNIAKPDLPPGYVIRQAKEQEYPLVYRLQRECFRDHWGFVEEPFEQGYKQFVSKHVSDPFYTPELWFVIEYKGELVGMLIGTASNSYGEDYGWINSLGVVRNQRKKGLGRALLLRAFNDLESLGSVKVGLYVDAQNLSGATRLYQGLGMREVNRTIRFEKTLREGQDLRTLRAAEAE